MALVLRTIKADHHTVYGGLLEDIHPYQFRSYYIIYIRDCIHNPKQPPPLL